MQWQRRQGREGRLHGRARAWWLRCPCGCEWHGERAGSADCCTHCPCSHWLGAPLPPSRLQRFRFINDIKAGVPRTAYQGVTIVRHNGCRKLLVASDSPLLQ